MPRRTKGLNNIVVVSDLHCGCRLGLCPPGEVKLDDGGTYSQSRFQKKLWSMWESFWNEFVPEATRGEPFGVVVNGDVIDGVHHRSTTQISHNLNDQIEIAYAVLKPIVEKCDGVFWLIRGTEAHSGPSAQHEEQLARRLGAIPNSDGQYARWELWKWMGDREQLVHFLHHIGTTSSQQYEATAVHKELVEALAEAARWGRRPPDAIVRSHRHRFIHTSIATIRSGGRAGRALAVVTPGWQGKTPFMWRTGLRLSPPQFGGVLIRYAHGRLFVDARVWAVEPSQVE